MSKKLAQDVCVCVCARTVLSCSAIASHHVHFHQTFDENPNLLTHTHTHVIGKRVVATRIHTAPWNFNERLQHTKVRRARARVATVMGQWRAQRLILRSEARFKSLFVDYKGAFPGSCSSVHGEAFSGVARCFACLITLNELCKWLFISCDLGMFLYCFINAFRNYSTQSLDSARLCFARIWYSYPFLY